MPRKNKPRQPTAKHYEVATNIKNGLSPAKACRAAGFSESTVRTGKLMKTPEMAIALAEIGAQIPSGQLGKRLITMPRDERVQLGVIRTGLEADAMLGGPSELHLHQHQNFHNMPQAAAQLMAEQMLRLGREKGETTAQTMVDIQQALGRQAIVIYGGKLQLSSPPPSEEGESVG